jgi:hypothetical protein
MIARRFAGIGVCVATLIFVGCETAPTPAPTIVAQTPPARPTVAIPTTAPTQSAAVDSPAVPPAALTQKTAAYAHSFEPTAAEEKSAAKPKPSSVQWETPKPPRASANAPTALPQPAAPVESTAQVAALAESAKSNALIDVPATSPESVDFAASTTAHPTGTFEQQIAQRVHDNPADMAAQLDNQLLAVVEDNSAPQLSTITALPSEDRELLSALIDGLVNFRTGIRQDENMLLSKKIQPILDMADRLRSEAELSVPTVALCTRVDGFGKYEVIDPPRFPAGRENPAIVYCEIQNFDSRMNDQKQWETKLTQDVNVFTETGMLVWKEKSRDVSDICRNRRHDFFMYDLIKLPPSLTIGRYIVKVTIVDRNANRIAEKTVPVEIVAGDSQ